MNRRKVLRNIGTGIGAIALTPTVVNLFQSCQTNISYTPVFVSKEDFEVFSDLMELIIPHTDIPGAKELKLPEFIDAYVDAVWSSENKVNFSKGWAEFKTEALQASAKENISQLTTDNLDAQLAKYLKSRNTPSEKDKQAAEFAKELRNLTVNAFKTNEFMGENVLAYSPVPGDYKGCVDLMETTGGKAWSL
jgi:hypothetical protein